MNNQHIQCLKKACEELNITYRSVGQSKVFLMVKIGEKEYPFIANEVPFNNYLVTRIADDKGFTYDLLGERVKMPRTVSILDPDCAEVYQPFVQFHSHDQIALKIEEEFSYPIVVKKNSGSQGENVFRCENRDAVLQAIKAIYDKTSLSYDHVLLAQECVEIAHEYRVTVFQKKIELMYEKDFSAAKFTGNLSPLHWEGSKAVIIKDAGLQSKIQEFIQPIYTLLDLEYGGLDIAIDKNGELFLFELNIKPGYIFLMTDNGVDPLVEIYKLMLKHLQQKVV